MSDRISISVVLATIEPWPDLANCLAVLEPQVAAVGGEIIVGDGHGAALDASKATSDRLTWVRMPGASVFELRARAAERARGEIIALTEDHCIVGADWCRQILEAFAGNPTAMSVAGPVLNGSTTSRIDWANFVHSFGAYFPPVNRTQRDRCPPPANVAFRRSTIGEGPISAASIELDLNPRLFRAGLCHVHDGITVTHVQSHGFWGTLRAHFDNGRSTTGLLRGLWISRRQLPWTVFRGALRSMSSETRSAPAVRASLPLVFLLSCCHAAGEVVRHRRRCGPESCETAVSALVPPRLDSAGPLRIVHVSPAYAPLVGGAERLLQSVSERLVERGHDVTVLTFDCAKISDFISPRGAGLPRREILNGVRVIRVNPVGGSLNRLHQWWLRQRGGWRTTTWIMGQDLWSLGLPSGLAMLPRLARLQADVVTSVNWHFGVAFWVCPPRRLRRVARVAIPILHIDREWAHKPVYTRMLNDCDGVLVCTDAERDFVQARGGTEVCVAGAGVDPSRFERRDGACIRARYGVGDRPLVGFVGRQETLKGVATLIEAMDAVWRHVPDAMLLMAGQRAHREPAVAKMLAELCSADRGKVVLIDNFTDEDGPSIMDACDLLALPSVEESFGLVMIEAWMCGKPVIGADIPSTRCIIESGVDGWIVKKFDSADLATKILDLLADPAKRALFGERGRAKVLSRYTWSRVTDAWEATFQKAAATR